MPCPPPLGPGKRSDLGQQAIVHESIWHKYVNAEAKLLDFRAKRNGAATWSGRIRYIDGTTWTRRAEFLPTGKLILTDEFRGLRGNETELRFHLRTTNAKMLSPVKCVTTDPKKPNILISVEGPEELKGKLSPVGISPSFTKREKGLLLCLTCRAGSPARWTTTIQGARR